MTSPLRASPYLCLLLAGCGFDFESKNECFRPGDCVKGFLCVAGECQEEVDWSCLPSESPVLDTPVELRTYLFDESTEAPITGATVRVCGRLDTGCATPVAVAGSDAEGAVEITVADHYIEIEATGYVPTLVMGLNSFELDELSSQMSERLDVTFDLFPQNVYDTLRTNTSVVLELDRGDILATVYDCNLAEGSGVAFGIDSADATTQVRYVLNDFPSLTATETDPDSASAFLFNVPTGLGTLTTNVSELGLPIGPPEAVIVRPQWLTHLRVVVPGFRIDQAL